MIAYSVAICARCRFTHDAVLNDPQAVARTIQVELEQDRRSLFQQLNGL